MSETGKLAKRRGRTIGAAFCLVAICWFGLTAERYVSALTATLPPVPDVAQVPVSTVVLDRNNKLLRSFTTEEGRWRLPVEVRDVDGRFVDMLLAYEDKNFATHNGVHWPSMGRAFVQFIGAGGKIVSGGSTLTMQVARLLIGGTTRSLDSKAKQILFAGILERQLSKDEILQLYLTVAPYGGNIEGIRAASLAYFGKEPARLTPAQSALLVALPQSPEARRPDRDTKAALAARNLVLERVAKAGVLSADVVVAEQRRPVPSGRREFPLLAAHLTHEAVLAHPDMREIKLPLDFQKQLALERLGAAHVRQISEEASVAIFAVEHRTGEVVASVGSAGLFADGRAGFVDMTKAVRSPGSTLKPLIYGLAFELGLAHPESLIEDRPTAFNAYVPANFDGFSRGTVTMRQALTASLNVPAVIALDAVGTARLMARMKRANAQPILPDDKAPGLAVGLGGVGVTLRDLVSLYAAMARGGRAVQLKDGVTAVENGGKRAPVLDPVSAWYVSDILRDVPPPLNGSPGRIAYKTGTSYGYRDAWAVGYDGKYVVGVWVGRPDGAPVPGITGITAAAPILFESFDKLGAAATPFRRPPSGVLYASNAELPTPLKRFRHPNAALVARATAPEIAFPHDGVRLELGMAANAARPLTMKIRNGTPPFAYFANGAPFDMSVFGRQKNWTPDGPGYVTLSVVDAAGQSDVVTVFVE